MTSKSSSRSPVVETGPYVISMFFQKGGVGKTTTTLSLGAQLALKKRKVLLIDLDPQCNLTSQLVWGEDDIPDVPEGEIKGSAPKKKKVGEQPGNRRSGKLEQALQELRNTRLDIKTACRKNTEGSNTTSKTIVNYFQKFYKGEHQHDGLDEGSGEYTKYNSSRWDEKTWRPRRPMNEASNQRKLIKTAIDDSSHKTAKVNLFLIQGDPEIMVKCHDKLAEELGNPEGMKLTSTGAIHKLGALHAMIKTINRLEREQWSSDTKGFDFVILDMNPHPTFLNLLGMRSSDLILSPCGADLYSLKSLDIMMDHVSGQLWMIQKQLYKLFIGDPNESTGGYSLLKEKSLGEDIIEELRKYEDYIIPWNEQVKKLTCTTTGDGKRGSDWQEFLEQFPVQTEKPEKERSESWQKNFNSVKQKIQPGNVLPKFGPFLCLMLNPSKFGDQDILSKADSIWVNTMRVLLGKKMETPLGKYGARNESIITIGKLALSEEAESMIIPFLKLEGPIYKNSQHAKVPMPLLKGGKKNQNVTFQVTLADGGTQQVSHSNDSLAVAKKQFDKLAEFLIRMRQDRK